MDEINSLFYDEDLKQEMKLAFEGKPVSGFNVLIDYKNNSSMGYKGTFFEDSHIVTYKITFSDDTELTWHSLKDEKEMQQARQIFEKKVPQPKKEIILEPTDTTKEEEIPTSDKGDDSRYSNSCALI
ncbi:hypothetical protein [Legionella sp. WA2022007384]